MILWGKISHFSVFMVLQLLASYGKSGILELEDREEKAVIYMRDGCIEAVSVPRSDHLLGARLVKAGYLSATDLRKIILSSALRNDREYLGIALIRSGLVDRKAMIEVLKKQTYENALELSNWVHGSFRFLAPREQALFPVSPHINVQHLLLETSRRLDEGQRPTKAKAELPGAELCTSCNAGCTKAQKKKYLRDGICLWRNMPVVVREAIFSPPDHKKIREEEEEEVGDLPFL